MYNKIITLNGFEYNLSSNIPISPETEKLALQKLGVQNLNPATCPPTSKLVNDTVTLNCTPTSGVSPFTVTFKKNGAILATRTNVAINTPAAPATDVCTNADATTGYADYSVTVIDSCTDPVSQTLTDSCRVSVHTPCPLLQFSFTVG